MEDLYEDDYFDGGFGTHITIEIPDYIAEGKGKGKGKDPSVPLDDFIPLLLIGAIVVAYLQYKKRLTPKTSYLF